MPFQQNHSSGQSFGNGDRIRRFTCVAAACLAVPTLVLGVLGFGLGVAFSGFEDTYQLLVYGGTMTLFGAAGLVLADLIDRWPHTKKWSFMLTTLGMIVGGIPMAFYKFWVPLYGGEFILYLVLAAGLIAGGAVGSFSPERTSSERGFEPIISRDD